MMSIFKKIALVGGLVLAPGFAQATSVTVDGIGPSGRIVINDTDGAAGALALGAPFENVVELIVDGSGLCSGGLISPTVVVTARHCMGSANSTVTSRFYDSSGDLITSVGSTSVSFVGDVNDPLLDGGDLAIVQLSSAVTSVTPFKFTDTLSVGDAVITVGFGLNGTGTLGHQFTRDGERWGAANVVDAIGQAAFSGGSASGTANIISTDFDDGTASNNTLSLFGSSATPVALEGTTAGGDSGGPLLVLRNGEWVIAGVLSGGTSNTSQFGDVSWWTSTTDGSNRAFVEAAGGQFQTAVVPLPAGGVLLVGALVGLGLTRRRAA